MTGRLTAITLLLMSAAGMRADVVAVDTAVDARPLTVSFNYRVKPQARYTAHGEIRWNVADSANYRFAHYSCERNSSRELWDNSARLSVGQCVGGQRTTESSGDYRIDEDPFEAGLSLWLKYANGGAALHFGSVKASDVLPVGYDIDGPQRFQAVTGDNDIVMRRRLTVAASAPIVASCHATVDSLKARLESSTDPCEGIWRYYDRDNDPLRSRPGGNYLLATAADGNGGYEIIYLGGATEHTDLWQPMTVKGRLTPTVFPNLFDLYWIAADGTPVDYATDASIADGLLTLHFPYWKSTLRFSLQK